MGKFDNETVCLNALRHIMGGEPKLAKTIVDTLGTASALFDMDADSLDAFLGPYSKHRGEINGRTLEQSVKELEENFTRGGGFTGYGQEGYPELLKDCPDAPMGLFFRAGASAEETFSSERRMIAVVGTRDMSSYGEQWCRNIVKALAMAGEPVTIVSGLALGVDGTAHRAALEYGIPTIAVMATGIDRVYPGRHRSLAREIAAGAGSALVTDYPAGTAPMAFNFVRRNRIIAGMSYATILIESKAKGGGLLTADLAYSYDREIYALPGRMDDLRSQGCNHLIAKHTAEVIESPGQLIRALGFRRSHVKREKARSVRDIYGAAMTSEELEIAATILELIRCNRDIGAEEMAAATGIPYGELAALLVMFENDSLITRDLLGRCSILNR